MKNYPIPRSTGWFDKICNDVDNGDNTYFMVMTAQN